MQTNNEITKIPFHGNEIVVIEKNGKQYVAMKPIVEAMGLAWQNQYNLIKKDAVLSEGIIVTMIPSTGGIQETVCLPLEYLNGWLFKVPASRYKGKKRERIITYQQECYKVLYEYFHKGGSINKCANKEQLPELLKAVAAQTASAISETMGEKILHLANEMKTLDKVIDHLREENQILGKFSPKSTPGEISVVTGKPRDRFVRGYFTSNRTGRPVSELFVQGELQLGV